MAKTANLYVRIDPELKEQAEEILGELSISASNAISMFYKQIVLQNGLPFELKLPTVPDISKMTAEELDDEIQKGVLEANAGKAIPLDEAMKVLKANLQK